MKVGFTGTRDGMTARQFIKLSDWFNYPPTGPWTPRVPSEAHHGCCLGADSDFQLAVIRGRIGGTEARAWAEIHAHPCNLGGMVCRHTEALADHVHPPKPPLDRNRDIVDACDVLLACPKGPEERRSGTWATIRYAIRVGKPVVIFWPDGKFEETTGVPG